MDFQHVWEHYLIEKILYFPKKPFRAMHLFIYTKAQLYILNISALTLSFPIFCKHLSILKASILSKQFLHSKYSLSFSLQTTTHREFEREKYSWD